MRTLAQIRAANALSAAHEIGACPHCSEFPTMIKTDGLLPTLAFSLAKRDDRLKIANKVADHLTSRGIDITQAENANGLVEELARAEDASQLRRATAEALAYLNYLKRFVA